MLPDCCALLLTGVLAAGTVPEPPAPVDPEMLEFLGSFETRAGQWLDPLSLREDHETLPAKPVREEKQHD